MNKFSANILAQHPKHKARIMEVTTPHGTFQTPAFMPVATRAYMNLASPAQVQETGSQIILGGNTYHMLVKPGMEVISASGGMHQMMAWPHPMLTDSGGFQVFSLSKNSQICKIDDQGARFKHPESGQVISLNPMSSIKTQKTIGADIIMAFDQCTAESGGRELAEKAMSRTHQWLLQSLEAHHQQPCSDYGNQQALFGIIQGGCFEDLREKSAAFVTGLPLDGFAIGGESIGFDMEKTKTIVSSLEPMLPERQLRYTMGVGAKPDDLIAVVSRGIDMFDCVAPTRNARHGSLYNVSLALSGDWVTCESDLEDSPLLIKKTKFALDDRPIMAGCDCYTCQHYSRAYLHYLFKMKSNFYFNLAAIHNIRVMQSICELMRSAICLSSQ